MSTLKMTSFLPGRFRGPQVEDPTAQPGWINRKITPLLQNLSLRAYTHPIHTVVLVALLASSTYIGLLDETLLKPDTRTVRRADWSSLVEGSRQLMVGEETGWKWQSRDGEIPVPAGTEHLALLTFVFPDSLSDSSPQTAPHAHTVPLPHNLSIRALPCTSNAFSPLSQDSALAFSIPFDQAPEFLASAQEIPNGGIEVDDDKARAGLEADTIQERKVWIMKAARAPDISGKSIRKWASNAWTEFVDLLKNAQTLDIIIMSLGYLCMHVTFISLYLSMRNMGSNFWLFASTIFSSVFAFLFGLLVTTKLGVPINVLLLSEGLPFLVVTVGFEKATILTKAVLSAAIDHRRPLPQDSPSLDQNAKKTGSPTSSIRHAIEIAIRDKGYEIVRDYAIEISVLIAGAASGVKGGLQQFCFLAAWILFFDCLLLFTFYTSILSIKLEINRIKRHVELRRALEDDGISTRVAENVAQINDWPSKEARDAQSEKHIFGLKVKDSSVPKFKILMISGFIIINVINLCTIPFRRGNHSTIPATVSGISGRGFSVITPPLDPFKVAANGLNEIFDVVKAINQPTVVTVLSPIKYELEYPSVHYATPKPNVSNKFLENEFGGYMGGRVADNLLKSLEDPVLSKWIVLALGLSVVLNGYLFNAARWSIKDPQAPDHLVDPVALANAERFNAGQIPGLESSLIPAQAEPVLEPPATAPAPPPVPADLAADDEGKSPIKRTPEQLEKMLLEKRAPELTDKELIELALSGKIPGYALERTLRDTTRAVKIRRGVVSRTAATAETTSLLERSKLPYEHYNWDLVLGACCENVIGYMPLPVGVAGPIVIDGRSYFLPMATTEGVLVASTSRGAKAINAGGGAVTVLTGDGMTRGPCVGFETLERAGAAKIWLDSDVGQSTMKKAFNSTSRFARLQSMKTAMAGTYLYIRFKTTTGDAMGMNMISKGVEHALHVMSQESGFEDMAIITVSGNYCTDKKAAAINWIDGRGKSVVAEAIIPADVVRKVLKSDVDALVELNVSKNLIGSAMAGSIGGFNAHAANIVTAIFLATGQDPAQNVESSNCITVMKK